MDDILDDSEEDVYGGESPDTSTLHLRKELEEKNDMYTSLKERYNSLQRKHEEEFSSYKTKSNEVIMVSKKKYKKLKIKFQQQLQQQDVERKKHISDLSEQEKLNQIKISEIVESKETIQNQVFQLSKKLKWMGMQNNQIAKENGNLKSLNKEYEQNLHLMQANMKKMLGHVREKVESYKSDENERKVLQDEILRRDELIKMQKMEFEKQEQENEEMRTEMMEMKMQLQETIQRYESQQEVIENQKTIIKDQHIQAEQKKLEIEKITGEKNLFARDNDRLQKEKARNELLVMKHQHRMELIESKLNSEIPSVQKKFDAYQSEISTLQETMYHQKVNYLTKLKERDTELTQLKVKFNRTKNESIRLERSLNKRNEIHRKRLDVMEEQYRTKNEHLLRQSTLINDPLKNTQNELEKHNQNLLLTHQKMSHRIQILSGELERYKKKLVKRDQQIEYIKKRYGLLQERWGKEDELKMNIIKKLQGQVETLSQEGDKKIGMVKGLYEKKIAAIRKDNEMLVVELERKIEDLKKNRKIEELSEIIKEKEEAEKNEDEEKKDEIIIERLLSKIQKMKHDDIKKKCLNLWKLKAIHNLKEKKTEEEEEEEISSSSEEQKQEQKQPQEAKEDDDDDSDVEEKKKMKEEEESGYKVTVVEEVKKEEKSIECDIIKSPQKTPPKNKNKNKKKGRKGKRRKGGLASGTRKSSRNRYEVQRKRVSGMVFLTRVTRKDDDDDDQDENAPEVLRRKYRTNNKNREVTKRKKKKQRQRQKTNGSTWH